MTICIIAEIDNIVVTAAYIAEQGRADWKAIIVNVNILGFAVHIVNHRQLTGDGWHREILPIDIHIADPVFTRRFDNTVQARIGVLFQPPKDAIIILDAVIVTVAEIAKTKLQIVEQKAAEIGLKRLDTDADAVKVIAVRHVAQVFIDEEFLHAQKMIKAMAASARLNEQQTTFGNIDKRRVERQRNFILELWRLKCG